MKVSKTLCIVNSCRNTCEWCLENIQKYIGGILQKFQKQIGLLLLKIEKYMGGVCKSCRTKWELYCSKLHKHMGGV